MLSRYSAWITGIRRDQAPTRANAGLIEWDKEVQFNQGQSIGALDQRASLDQYLQLHEVPYNQLHDRNYPSIRCTHCTAPVLPGDDPRSGRWEFRQDRVRAA